MKNDIQILNGDCLEVMQGMRDNSVDLVICSPPYEAARSYSIGFDLKGMDWVNWALPRFLECVRISKGLVAWVVEGQTKNFSWSPVPVLLMAELYKHGVTFRKPAIFSRVGICGSGGPDWLRNDWEWIICATSGGKLPWSDNTAMGHPPKYGPGGEMSHRVSNGSRRNQWGGNHAVGGRTKAGKKANQGDRPSHTLKTRKQRIADGEGKVIPPSGERRLAGEQQSYIPPVLANPGNIIKCKVGGGLMGNKICHENEAPFPEKLVEFFIRSFCPPGGIVLDCFCGSGTTLAVAKQFNRKAIGIDIRESQVKLTKRRTTNTIKGFGL